MISIIATIGKNNEIGNKGKLLWNLPSDLKFFKKLTINHTVVMGRVCYDKAKHLFPNRYNIVVSKTLGRESGIEIVNDTKNIIDRFLNTDDDVYIVGGASMYEVFLPYATKLYLTEIDDTKEADAFFPKVDKNLYSIHEIDKGIENNISYKHVIYRKK